MIVIPRLIPISINPDPDAFAHKVAAPPKRWRNRWRAISPAIVTCVKCWSEETVLPGQVFENCCLTYPSKDVAESDAQRDRFQCNSTDYLGAFPVDAA